MHALRGSALPCFTVPPSRAGALKCMSHVNTFFFNIFCAGTAPEGRGRTGDIKKGLLYWFITTVAQQCTIPRRRRRSSLSGLVVAFLDDPIVISNYPYQDQEQDHIPTREGQLSRVGMSQVRKCSWNWKWEELQLTGIVHCESKTHRCSRGLFKRVC